MADPAEPIPLIESPCIGTCTVGSDGLCLGCFRNLDEIAGWLGFSARQRLAIMASLPERAQSLFDDD